MSDEECDPLIEELARREVARSSLADFAAYINPAYNIAWFHRLISDAIDRMFLHRDDPYSLRRLLITLSPRHGKSELLSRMLPPFIFGKLPDSRIIGCSYGADLAHSMCRDTQQIITGQRYKILFPNTRIMEGTGGTVRRISETKRTAKYYEILGHRGYYLSAGVDGPITGKGFDWGIIDDPVKNAADADSAVKRDHALKWYKSVFRNRAEGDARIVAIGTLWSPEDLMSTLIRQTDSDLSLDKWHIIKLPAQAWGALTPGDPRKDGEWLWPWKYTAAEYEALRSESGPRAWESLFQCNPTGEGAQEWDPKFFEDANFFIPDAEWPKSGQQITTSTDEEFVGGVLGVDPSKGVESKKGDYSAIAYMGRTNTRRVLGDMWTGRVSAEVLIDNIIEMTRKHRPQWIVGEQNAFQNLILEALVRRLSREGLGHIRVIPVEHKEKKELRIRRLGPIISGHNGGWKWKLNMHTRLLQQQLRLFPNASHDDTCDAAELALRYLVQLINNRYNRQTTVLKV